MIKKIKVFLFVKYYISSLDTPLTGTEEKGENTTQKIAFFAISSTEPTENETIGEGGNLIENTTQTITTTTTIISTTQTTTEAKEQQNTTTLITTVTTGGENTTINNTSEAVKVEKRNNQQGIR